jgi:hypothetical protein
MEAAQRFDGDFFFEHVCRGYKPLRSIDTSRLAAQEDWRQ